MKVFTDTNVLLNDDFHLENYEKVYISIVSIEELDGLKKGEQTGYAARHATKAIESANNVEIINFTKTEVPFLEHKNDNTILAMFIDIHNKDNEVTFLTDDYNLIIKAKTLNLPCELFKFKENKINYKGYKEVILDEYEMATFYECMVNKWDLNINEYLVIKDLEGNVTNKLKWTENGFKNLSYRNIDSKNVGKVKPRNLQQELYMDLLQDKETKLKMVLGNFGAGKDFLALANFLTLIEKGTYNKIVWVRNNIEAEGTKPIGFLLGSLTEKLSVYADIVSDFMGDKYEFEKLLRENKLELVHAGFIRGRDLKNSIIYCTEAQNMSESLVKLILSRVSEGSIIFFNGDIKQTDDKIFRYKNGLELLLNKLQGNPLFGYVYLDKCERSEVAQLVSLLD